MLYVLTTLRGGFVRWATSIGGLRPIPADAVVVPLAAWDAPPPLPYVWSPEARDWVVPVPAPVDQLSKLAFRWRYTLAEQVAISAAEESHPSAEVRATLRVLRESLQEATDIRLSDPRTMAGVQYHAQLGLITAERAAEILTP
jgi:hypothetical protein